MENIETIEKQKDEYKYQVKIWIDEFVDNPRSWDNLFVLDLYHPKYDLGDIKHKGAPFDSIKEWEDSIKANNPDIIHIEKVFLYEHSGISINLGGLKDCWDSSFIGFVYTTKKRLNMLFGDNQEIDLKEILKGEIETYNKYLGGEVYGATIYFMGEIIESCGGYFGYNQKESGLNDFIEDTIKNHNPKEEEIKKLKEDLINFEQKLIKIKERLKGLSNE